MTIERINYGAAPNDGTGDLNRNAWMKADNNFVDLDTRVNAAIPLTQKGAAGGVAPLGQDNRVPSANLPSYVDDVLEYSSLSAFPATGEAGKIYTALDTNKIYRWSGSTYVEISASPGSTDAVPEGVTNKYFTQPRVITALTDNAEAARAALGVYSEGQTIPIFRNSEVPTTDVGPIEIRGRGLAEWDATTSKYVLRHIPIYTSATTPTVDLGPIYVVGVGVMTYQSSSYKPAPVRGVMDGSNAVSGAVGEYLSLEPAVVATAASTVWNHGGLTLTPGEWDVSFGAQFNPGAGSSIQTYRVDAADTSTAHNAEPWRQVTLTLASGVSAGQRLHSVPVRFNITANKILYLNTEYSPTGPVTVQPFMHARRVR